MPCTVYVMQVYNHTTMPLAKDLPRHRAIRAVNSVRERGIGKDEALLRRPHDRRGQAQAAHQVLR